MINEQVSFLLNSFLVQFKIVRSWPAWVLSTKTLDWTDDQSPTILPFYHEYGNPILP